HHTAPPEIYTLSLHDALPISNDLACAAIAARAGRCPKQWLRCQCARCRQRVELHRALSIAREDAVGGQGMKMTGEACAAADIEIDRKSTRLNSSHVKISYAVF